MSDELERNAELDEFDSAELMRELLARHDIGAIILLSFDNEEGHVVRRKWRGCGHTLMGLCVDVVDEVTREYKASEKPL